MPGRGCTAPQRRSTALRACMRAGAGAPHAPTKAHAPARPSHGPARAQSSRPTPPHLSEISLREGLASQRANGRRGRSRGRIDLRFFWAAAPWQRAALWTGLAP